MPDYKRMVRREIFRLRSTVTDDVLFSSDEFREYLQSILDAAVALTDRSVRIHMLPSGERDTAYTNGEDVYINTSSPLLCAAEDRVERYMLILGAVVHETGHILFTDFPVQKKHLRSFTEGEWFPSPPSLPGAEKIMARMETDAVFSSLLLGTLARIRNITEDIYVEYRLEQRFAGLFIEGLHSVAASLRKQAYFYEDQLADAGWTRLEILLSQLLQVARFGSVKARDADTLPDEDGILRTLERMSPYVEKLRSEKGSAARCSCLNELLTLALPFVEELADDEDAAGAAERLRKEAGSIMPAGDSSPAEWDEEPGAATDPGKTLEETEEIILRSMAEKGTERMHASALRTEAIGIMEKVSADTRGRLASAVPRSRSTAELLEYRKTCSVPPSSVRIHRPASNSPGLVSAYEAAFRAVRSLARRTVRLTEAALSERQKEGRETGFSSGRHIAPETLCRPDGRIFSRSSLPDGKPDICVCVLVDESGSMYLDNRITAALRTAVLLEAVLRDTLDRSSYAVIGHSADLDSPKISLDLYVYKDFDDTDDRDRYRLADMQARAQNRDGDAVRYCCERLLGRPEKRKLLIVITDGVPLALEYGGDTAEKELSLTAEEYRRRGIGIFAASIGDPDTGRAVSGIYGSSWTMDCSELSALPVRLSSLLRRLISRV